MTDLEKLTKQIFEECAKDGDPVTIEEARQMAEMEIGAKSINNYTESAEKPRKKSEKAKIVKVSDEKIQLFDLIWEGLSNFYENAEILKQNKLISVQIADKTFKIDIIEQRPTKK